MEDIPEIELLPFKSNKRSYSFSNDYFASNMHTIVAYCGVICTFSSGYATYQMNPLSKPLTKGREICLGKRAKEFPQIPEGPYNLGSCSEFYPRDEFDSNSILDMSSSGRSEPEIVQDFFERGAWAKRSNSHIALSLFLLRTRYVRPAPLVNAPFLGHGYFASLHYHVEQLSRPNRRINEIGVSNFSLPPPRFVDDYLVNYVDLLTSNLSTSRSVCHFAGIIPSPYSSEYLSGITRNEKKRS
ncbi:hypothetical protein M422DRAFT_40731 [Sphaerobolus stellatus SS14]|nr:hypothetical protein M422DRAFT_40731 [Sphaerobolus stellatus SS14]